MQRGSHAFIFSDGSSIVSIEELLYKLKLMREDIFSKHVNVHKHDFADWISQSLGKPGLANLVRGAHDRKSLMLVLDTYLTKLKKHRSVGTFASVRTHHTQKAASSHTSAPQKHAVSSHTGHKEMPNLLEEAQIHTVKEEEVLSTASAVHTAPVQKTHASAKLAHPDAADISQKKKTDKAEQAEHHGSEEVAAAEHPAQHQESSDTSSQVSQRSPALSHSEIVSFAQTLAQHMGPLEKLKQEWHRTHHEIGDMRTKLMELDEHIKEQKFRLRDLIRQRQMLKQSIID